MICPGGSGGYRFRHIVDCAKGNDIEFAGFWHGFDASRPYFYGKMQGADNFSEKCGLFVLRFSQGNAEVGTEDGYGKAGEACSAAKVEERGAGP